MCLSQSDDISCAMKAAIRDPLCVVLETEMKVAFDHLWKDVVFRKPPWTLDDLLASIEK